MRRTGKQQYINAGKGLCVAAVALTGMAGNSVLAQQASELEALQAPPPENEYRFSLGAGWRSQADIQDRNANIGETALRLTGVGDINLTDEYRLIPVASYQYSYYHLGDIGGDRGEGRIDDTRNMSVNMLRLSALLSYDIDEEWSVYGGPSVGFAAEAGAEIGDSFSGGALAGFNYRFADNLSLGAGVGLFSRLGDSPSMLPFITANWEFADQWNARIGFQEVAGNGGYGAEVMYDLLNNFKVGGGVQVEQKRWRLKDRGDRDGGVAQDRNVPIYGKLAWEPQREFALEVVAGIAAGGQVRVQDASGHHWRSVDYDPSALIGLRAVLRF